MQEIEQIEDWRGQDVLDSGGEKIGKVDEVYFPVSGGAAEFVAVKRGLLGRRSHLVPLADATVARDYIRVAFTQEQVALADGAADGVLDARIANGLAELYGVAPRNVEYESASLIEERRVAAEQARRRADELELRAREKIVEVDEARQAADDAAARADRIEREAQRAREDAAAARTEADTLQSRRHPS